MDAKSLKSRDELLPAIRRQQLIDWFDENIAGSTQDLAGRFHASVSTIRRDLDLLAREGYIKRTHGGAVRTRQHTAYEPSTDLAHRTAVEEKRAIISEAIRQISSGQTLLIDTGAIAHSLADTIAELSINLTVVSNDIYVAKKLTYKPNLSVIVPGGTNRPKAYGLIGEPGASFIRDLRCDVFFMSAQAIDKECISDPVLEIAQQKRALVEAADKTILIAESARFNARALHRVLDISHIDMIITDAGLIKEDRKLYEALGPELLCVEVN